MKSIAEVLYNVYKASGTLQPMDIFIDVYGQENKARMIITDTKLSVFLNDDTVVSYPESVNE